MPGRMPDRMPGEYLQTSYGRASPYEDRAVPLFVPVLLVIVSCPVVMASFPSSPVNTSHKTHKESTKGKSGVRCTRINQHCLTDVPCVNHECVCPVDQKGNGMIECVGKDDLLCIVSADPHLFSYGGARVDVDIPCRYRLTRYVTGHRKAATPHAICSVEVFSTNELNRGQYYVRSVHISLGLTDHGKQVHDQLEVKKYGVSDDQIFQFLANVTTTRTVWGSSLHEKINGVDVFPTFDENNNFAILSVPHCGTRIKYRVYDRSRHRQPLLPGISIMAPHDVKFVKKYGNYPHSLCGTDVDDEHLFHQRAKDLGLRSKKLAIIFDILTEGPAQTANPKKEECDRAIHLFKNSQHKVADLNFCGRILTHVKSRKCIFAAGQHPITAFNMCLDFRQTGSADACHFLQNLRHSCRQHWRGPKVQC